MLISEAEYQRLNNDKEQNSRMIREIKKRDNELARILNGM